jgi:hypothetical protein
MVAQPIGCPQERLHIGGITGSPEKSKPRKKLRFRAAPLPESLWKGKAIIAQ